MTRNDKLWCALACIVIAVSAYIQYIAGFAGDKDGILITARLWMDGQVLYRDIFEVNPPLIFWMYSLPERFARFSGMEDYHALVLIGLACIALSISLCLHVIQYHPAFAGNKRRQVQLAFLLCFILIVWTNPIYFFDREHIWLVLGLPYIFRLLPSLASARLPLMLRIVMGAMAGIGFCLKPHCAIIFCGIQLVVWLRERRLRVLFSVENGIIVGIACLYLVSVWVICPEYVTLILPTAAATYAADKSKFGGGYLFIAAYTLLITFVDYRTRFVSPFRKDIRYFLWLSFFLTVYALLNNGWGYTYNPLFSMLYLTNGWVLWDAIFLYKENRENPKIAKRFLYVRRNCWINFIINSGLVVILCFQALSSPCGYYTQCRLTQSVIKAMQAEHAHSFAVLTLSFIPGSPMLREPGISIETRFYNLWMLPKFFVSAASFTQAHETILRYVAEGYAEDFNNRRPDIIIVDDSPQFGPTGKYVDLVAYFEKYPDFKKAWDQYRYADTIDYCQAKDSDTQTDKKAFCKYAIYERIGK